jgi:predicted nucleic-acid-binding Zn-ribbon protein
MKQINGFDFIDKPMPNCPKCDGIGAEVKFIPTDIKIARAGQQIQYTLGCSDKEYLLYTCDNCGYMCLSHCKDGTTK